MISQTSASKPGVNMQQSNPGLIQSQQREIAAFTSYHLDILFPKHFIETI